MLLYIQYYLKLDRKNTILYLLLQAIVAAFFSVETVVIAYLIDSIISNIKNEKVIAVNMAGLAAVWLVKRLMEYLAQRRWIKLREKTFVQLPEQIVQKKRNLSYMTLENKDTQELMQRVGKETETQFCEYFENNISLLVSVIEMIGLLAVIFTKSVLVGAILAVILIPYILFSIKNGKMSYEAIDLFTNYLYESYNMFAGYGMNQKVNRKIYEADAIQFESRNFLDTITKSYRGTKSIRKYIDTWMMVLLLYVPEIIVIIIYLYSANHFLPLILLLIVIPTLIVFRIQEKEFSIQEEGISTLQRKRETFEDHAFQLRSNIESRVLGYLPSLQEKIRNYFKLAFSGEENKAAKITIDHIEKIEFQNVSFSYPERKEKALNQVSFVVRKGEHLAIVGENGSGKSTLLKLLSGIYECDEGQIRINDIDIKEIEKKSLYSQFSAVFQNYGRYAMNIHDNICLNQDEDAFRMERVKSLRGLEELNKIPSEAILSREFGGMDLSGGQWQRVAIARSQYRSGEIYLLDEPTSAIDPNEEKTIYDLFQEMMKHKTSLIVTHRMGATRLADRIIVLNKGKISGDGSHESLIEGCPDYQQLWTSQAQLYLEFCN